MSEYIKYFIVFLLLFIIEILYFKIAKIFHIIDKPTIRSSHSSIVLRGGGIIFPLSLWIYCICFGLHYHWFIIAVTLVACVSFIDDIHSLQYSSRLIIQFIAMFLMLFQLGIIHWDMCWIIIIALVLCVGASNIFNFMDGINGMTGAYTIACIIPLLLINNKEAFIDNSLIVTVALADIVFCFFNFRGKGKAKCFAGDVGSIGISFILLFIIGMLIINKNDATYLIFLIVYGIDGCLTICHRIMLHDNIREAHRKHAYQILANELKISHIVVASSYAIIQLLISLVFLFICPDSPKSHWLYLIVVSITLSIAYIIFIKKYYHLHSEFLSLKIHK